MTKCLQKVYTTMEKIRGTVATWVMAVAHHSRVGCPLEPGWHPWAEKPHLPPMHPKEYPVKFGIVLRAKQERWLLIWNYFKEKEIFFCFVKLSLLERFLNFCFVELRKHSSTFYKLHFLSRATWKKAGGKKLFSLIDWLLKVKSHSTLSLKRGKRGNTENKLLGCYLWFFCCCCYIISEILSKPIFL